DQLGAIVVGQAGQQRGVDVTGTDAVDAQTVRTVLRRGVAGDADHAVLGRGACAVADRRDGAVNRRHVDDAASLRTALEHRGDLVPHPVHHAVEVDVDDPIPFVEISFASDRSGTTDSSVVDGVVQPAPFLDGDHNRLPVR